jgi:hypothetical protein
MKKVKVIFAGVLFLFLSIGANSQTKTEVDYFLGKWNVLITGTPNGDARMVFILEKKDNTISGIVQDTTGVEISKITNTEVSENQVTVYFNTQGYDINLVMEKKDEDHIKGSLMGMFDATGNRVKENKK